MSRFPADFDNCGGSGSLEIRLLAAATRVDSRPLFTSEAALTAAAAAFLLDGARLLTTSRAEDDLSFFIALEGGERTVALCSLPRFLFFAATSARRELRDFLLLTTGFADSFSTSSSSPSDSETFRRRFPSSLRWPLGGGPGRFLASPDGDFPGFASVLSGSSCHSVQLL